MLSIVETLIEFRNILLPQKIIIWTDHKNNVNPITKHASNRIIRWRWLIDEFGPEFQYIPGIQNHVADSLSRLDADFTAVIHEDDVATHAENLGMDSNDCMPRHAYPLSAQYIAQEQK